MASNSSRRGEEGLTIKGKKITRKEEWRLGRTLQRFLHTLLETSTEQHTYHITYSRGNTSTQNSTIYYNKISNFSFETAFLMLVVVFNLGRG